MAKFKAALIMGSDSDFPQLIPCINTLRRFSVECEVKVISAHRTPLEAVQFARDAKQNGFGVIIAAAGKAAHLAGILAANTILPVIGIPIKSSTLDGLDSLLSTVQMPSGVPVATVAIDGSANAALLAVQMFALSDCTLAQQLEKYKEDMQNGVAEKNTKIQKLVSDLEAEEKN